MPAARCPPLPGGLEAVPGLRCALAVAVRPLPAEDARASAVAVPMLHEIPPAPVVVGRVGVAASPE